MFQHMRTTLLCSTETLHWPFAVGSVPTIRFISVRKKPELRVSEPAIEAVLSNDCFCRLPNPLVAYRISTTFVDHKVALYKEGTVYPRVRYDGILVVLLQPRLRP